MTTHPSFDEISQLVDAGAPSEHVDACADCRAVFLRIRSLRDAARALPRDLAPPPELLPLVRARFREETRAGPRATRSRWWHNGWLAAAAGLVLVIGTAAIVSLLPRDRTPRPTSAAVRAAPTAGSPGSPGSLALLAVDKSYIGTIRELRAALEAERSTLAPRTIQTVERSLQIIDAAIAEARAALAADPNNQALLDILASHYERQLDLLQRATELSSSL